MKKMVLVVVVLSVIGIFAACKSLDYAQPPFEKPNSFVIDSYSVSGSLEDNVRIYNQTSRSNISFTVYVHDFKANAWQVFGTGNLKERGDADYIRNRSLDLDDYRYFAIEALDKKDYAYTFFKRSNDLHITITDK